jgi:hypothetical protein
MESLGDVAAVLTKTDLILFDETSEKSLAVGRFSKLISQIQQAELLYIQTTRQLYVVYGLQNETGYNHALIWDRDTDTFGQRDFQFGATSTGAIIIPTADVPLTWEAATQTWDTITRPWGYAQNIYFNYAAAYGGGIYIQGSEPQGWLIGRDKIPSAQNDVIRLRSIEASLNGPEQPVWLRIGVSDTLGEPTRWGTEKEFNVGGKTRNDNGMQGRYISWQVRGYGTAKLNEISLYYEPKGRKP